MQGFVKKNSLLKKVYHLTKYIELCTWDYPINLPSILSALCKGLLVPINVLPGCNLFIFLSSN